MKLCIFPNDPIISYYKNGEIIDRYFNPKNIFDEIHIISLIDKEVNEKEVQNVAGTGKLKIHAVGKFRNDEIKNSFKIIRNLIKTISPNVIRAYNTGREGWIASQCSKELKIPFFVSLYTRLDYNVKIAKNSNLKKFLNLKIQERFNEPEVLKQAQKITIAYKIIEPYVFKKSGKKPDLLYNGINCEKFSKGNVKKNLSKPLVLSVGKLIPEKNHECIIRAMKCIDAHCLIIGKGKEIKKLDKIIEKEKLQEKIKIIDYVSRNEIQDYYKSADVFALAYDPELEGLPIPVMEAMASGLPIVIPYQKEGFSDGIENSVMFSERTPESFHTKIEKILSKSLLPLLNEVEEERSAVIESGNPLDSEKPPEEPNVIAIRDKNWKLIVNLHNNTKELYNLGSDPEEKTNLITKNPKESEELYKKLMEVKNIESIQQ